MWRSQYTCSTLPLHCTGAATLKNIIISKMKHWRERERENGNGMIQLWTVLVNMFLGMTPPLFPHICSQNTIALKSTWESLHFCARVHVLKFCFYTDPKISFSLRPFCKKKTMKYVDNTCVRTKERTHTEQRENTHRTKREMSEFPKKWFPKKWVLYIKNVVFWYILAECPQNAPKLYILYQIVPKW